MFKFKCGDQVEDTITKFRGVVVCQSHYLTGCNRYAVQSRDLHDGKPQDWVYFDEDALIKSDENIGMRLQQRGGPVQMEAPQR